MEPSGNQTVANVWNDRVRVRGYTRDVNPSRPWYSFARQVLTDAGLCRGHAIDLGCGRGEFLDTLTQLGFSATGCDGESSYVSDLNDRGMDAHLCNLDECLPFPDGCADVVSCLEVIEHVVRTEFFVKEISRILKPGGHAVLSTPNYLFWRWRLDHVLGRALKGEGVHVRFFTRQGLVDLLQQNGLKVVSENHFGPLTGLNCLLKPFLGRRVLVQVGRPFVDLLAHNLLVLARKGESGD
jgi:2-polyprenyl-3-methyl-5-hydroxy-6-metoxy-1,4-benzoquinol methylase